MAPGPPPATLFLTPVVPSTDIGDEDLKYEAILRLARSFMLYERHYDLCKLVPFGTSSLGPVPFAPIPAPVLLPCPGPPRWGFPKSDESIYSSSSSSLELGSIIIGVVN